MRLPGLGDWLRRCYRTVFSGPLHFRSEDSQLLSLMPLILLYSGKAGAT